MFNVKKFKRLRKIKGLTAKDVAVKTGISTSAIYGYESRRAQPSQEVLTKLSNVFDVKISDLLTEDLEESKTVSETYNIWETETIKYLKAENERLWMLVQKITGAQVADLGKLEAKGLVTGQIKPFSLSVTRLKAA